MSGRRVCEINVYVNILVTRANGCGVEGQWYVGVSGRVIGMWGPWYVQSVIYGGLVVCGGQWDVEVSWMRGQWYAVVSDMWGQWYVC